MQQADQGDTFKILQRCFLYVIPPELLNLPNVKIHQKPQVLSVWGGLSYHLSSLLELVYSKRRALSVLSPPFQSPHLAGRWNSALTHHLSSELAPVTMCCGTPHVTRAWRVFDLISSFFRNVTETTDVYGCSATPPIGVHLRCWMLGQWFFAASKLLLHTWNMSKASIWLECF